MSADRTAAAGLFACLWAVALLTSHYGVVATDEAVYFFMARSLTRERTTDVPPFEMMEVHRGRDGRSVPHYPPGYPAALAPFVAGGRVLARLAGRDPAAWGDPTAERTAEIRGAFIGAALIGAAAGTAPFLALRALGVAAPAALGAALALAFGTPSLWYARTLMSEPLRTALALGALVAIARAGAAGPAGAAVRPAAAAGVALALAALVRLDSIFLWPAGALSVALASRPAGRRAAAALAAFLAPLALAGAAILLVNLDRFGDPFRTGYEHLLPGSEAPWMGIVANLAGPGRGLLWYGPVALLGLLGWPALARRIGAPAAVFAAAGAGTLLLATSATPAWIITWEWGPRYLHLAWTLTALGLATLPDRSVLPRAVAGLAVWGLAVNALGAASDFTRHYAETMDNRAVALSWSAWPVAAQARAVAAGRIDLPVLRTWLLAAGLAAAAAAGLRAAVRSADLKR